jgi:hypothetical protein
MKTFLLLLIFISIVPNKIWAQTSATVLSASTNSSRIDSTTQANIKKYYNLGLQYKDGKGVAIDYTKAYSNFLQAANLGDAQSIYAVAYMLYKGLGCTQDYVQAAELFAQGAYAGRENSIYFYGLCWRNGYGVTRNEDSAKYYLQKSADMGYKQATLELASPVGENGNDSAKALVQRISNAAMPENYTPNKFTKISPHLPPANIIAGHYTGYLIQYDWSGENAVSSKKLNFTITEDKGELTGKWVEDTDSTGITASLSKDTLKFNNTKYRRKDHYSAGNAILYDFQHAHLNLVQKGDSVFLAGNVMMFSPERNEPSKPLFVALTRTTLLDKNIQDSTGSNVTAKILKVYPNPFGTTLNVQVEIPKEGRTILELETISGQTVYSLDAGIISAGIYAIPLQAGHIAQGTYLLVIRYNGRSESVKVVKM